LTKDQKLKLIKEIGELEKGEQSAASKMWHSGGVIGLFLTNITNKKNKCIDSCNHIAGAKLGFGKAAKTCRKKCMEQFYQAKANTLKNRKK
jgi:hypothetical protein